MVFWSVETSRVSSGRGARVWGLRNTPNRNHRLFSDSGTIIMVSLASENTGGSTRCLRVSYGPF